MKKLDLNSLNNKGSNSSISFKKIGRLMVYTVLFILIFIIFNVILNGQSFSAMFKPLLAYIVLLIICIIIIKSFSDKFPTKNVMIITCISAFFSISITLNSDSNIFVPKEYRGNWNVKFDKTQDANKNGQLEIKGKYKNVETEKIYAEVIYYTWESDTGTVSETKPKYVKLTDAKDKYGHFKYNEKLGKNVEKATYKIYFYNPNSKEADKYVDNENNLVLFIDNDLYNQKQNIAYREKIEDAIAIKLEAERAAEEARKEKAREEFEKNRIVKVKDTTSEIIYEIYMEKYTDLYITGNASEGVSANFVLYNMLNNRLLGHDMVINSGDFKILLKGSNLDGYKRLIVSSPGGDLGLMEWQISVE